MNELSWTPTLRGGIYCSSACGGNCKKSDYDLAVKQSAALANRLGKGWKPRVAENLHWYWSVDKGPLSVSPSKPGYMIILNTDSWSFVEHGRQSNALVSHAVAALKAHIAELQATRTLIES